MVSKPDLIALKQHRNLERLATIPPYHRQAVGLVVDEVMREL